MAQNMVAIVPLAALSVVGLILLKRSRKTRIVVKFGAFIEEFEMLPPPPPAPPQAPPILSGLTFAVKDIFDIAGKVTGFGSPAWLKTHSPAETTAMVIELLVRSGAKLIGKTHMDELAYSINGENKWYGTPTNPIAASHVPGGSSSGSAVAVSAGLVDFAIGTDTGGSVRVPAAFCSVFGFRPSHGSISVEGVVPMAPSFDTVGLFARDALMLRNAGHVMLQLPFSPARAPTKILIADDLFDLSALPKQILLEIVFQCTEKLLEGKMQRVNVGQFLVGKLPSIGPFLGESVEDSEELKGEDILEAVKNAFRILQGYEFYANHGAWLTSAKPKLAADIESRVKFAKSCPEALAQEALKVSEELRAAMNDLLKADTILVLPTVGGFPPALNTKAKDLEEFRQRSFKLLSISGMSGCPQVSIPCGSQGGLPMSFSFMARYGADSVLLDTVVGFEEQINLEVKDQLRKQPEVEPLTLRPDAELAKLRGNAAYREKNFEAAIEAYTEAIRLDGGRNPIYFNNRAMAHLQICNFAECEQDCTSVLELDRRNVKAMLRRGTAREFVGAYTLAYEDFERALVYEPNNKNALECAHRLRSNLNF